MQLGTQASHPSSDEGELQIDGNELARQTSTSDRHGPEQQQQQSTQHAKALKAHQPTVKLHLNALRSGNDERSAGLIHIAQESWLERAKAKARANIQHQSK